MDPEHEPLGRNDAEVVDADSVTILTLRTIDVFQEIISRTSVIYREIIPRKDIYFPFNWHSVMCSMFELGEVLLKHILNDIVRAFEPITRTDIRRAVWTWRYRRDSVDPLFARFTIFTDSISQELGPSFLNRDFLSLRNLGDGLWRVSQVPRSPSPPPPPYSLFDLTSPTENFALVYHPMPMLPPPAFPSFEDSAKSVFSLKRKRITDVFTDDSENQRQRARQRRAPKNPAVRYDLRPRITKIA